ncbi:keratin, type I cytoskeletal 18-like [Procambarus clarkii]|uniref:keratin, type I cytoskeletal 18-like n=1 Tax=Procambarus clarkii TaxID=6728 RepID=UPI00374460D4
MMEVFALVLEDIRREMQDMNNTISNLQSELTAAKEEIKTLKENNTETEAQIIIQREDENGSLEGTAIVQATFAEMIKKNKEWGTSKRTGKSQCDQMMEVFALVLEDIRREMQDMNNTISNLQSELTAAKEEIKTLKENNTEAEAQIIIQREDENGSLEGTAIVQATFAEMIKKNKELDGSTATVENCLGLRIPSLSNNMNHHEVHFEYKIFTA